jgi:predicted PurR-regulated permease PerM
VGAEAPDPIREIRQSQVTLKTVFTVCFGVLLVGGMLAAVTHAIVAIVLTGAALMIAAALDHLVRSLQRRGMKRPLAIALVMLAGVGLPVTFAITLIPTVVEQCKQLFTDAPTFLHSMRDSGLFHRLDERFHLAEQLGRFEKQLPQMLEGAASPVLTALGGVLSAVGAVLSITFLTAFMLIFGERLVAEGLREARAHRRAMYAEVLHKIYDSLGGYLGGLMLICLINATLTTTFLAIDRVPFFLPLGILAGLSSMVPYAGPFTAGALISLLALATQGVWHGLAAAIYFVTYGQIEGNLLGPLIFRRTVHVNPLIVTLSILFFGEMAGVLGAIAAVPVVAVLQILLREVLRIRREKLSLTNDGPREPLAGEPLARARDSRHAAD